MEKKKTLKRLFKTLFAICLIAVLVVGGYFLFRPTDDSDEPKAPTGPSRYFLAQTAIFNEEFSQNFSGIYKFDRVNFVYLSHLSSIGQEKIYYYYGVESTLGLLTKLTLNKRNESDKNNETLIIEDGKFQFNKNYNPYLIGTICGNDDYSIMLDSSNKQQFSASLTNLSQSELENLTAVDEVEYHGIELYLTKQIEIIIENAPYKFEAVYVYQIQK